MSNLITDPNEKQLVPGQDVEDPWRARHDIETTRATIQEMLAGGTPDWVKWPQDYKKFAQEAFAAEKENSDRLAAQYRWHDQDVLSNAAARMINPMPTKEFIRKLRSNGVRCFVVDNGYPKQTVALWAIPPNRTDKARYICFMQVPAMYEWSVLRINAHGIPDGEDFRGWRTVIIQLVEKEILSEGDAHRIFGVPSPNTISARYFRSLWEKRNARRYVDLEEHEALVNQA